MYDHNKLATLAMTGALATSLAACGGSSSSGLTRSALITKANALCQTARTAVQAIPMPSSFQDAPVAAAYFDKLAPIVDRETADLRALKADSSASADWSAFIAPRVSQTALLDTIRRKADTKDPSGLQDLKTAQAGTKQLVDAASRFGATGCAQ